jgi:nitrogen fixation protein NifU and related proteins
MSVFSETVLDHFKNPRNTGTLDHPDAVAETTNPVCGDVLCLSVSVENGRIAAARFKVQGCVAAIASASVLTEMLIGKPLAEIAGITAAQIAEALDGLPQASSHAAQLSADAAADIGRALRSLNTP